MKILKFKNKQKFKYNKKVIIKDLTLLLSVGIHKFEKLKTLATTKDIAHVLPLVANGPYHC